MEKHEKFGEVEMLVKANIAVLLTGEKGSGKTTIVTQLAEELKLPFFTMSMTRQTTLSHLMGFMSVNGTYIPSLLKDAFENGGIFLLDEIDAADANVLLSLNTIENGYLSFPSGIVRVHKDFRLIATANPQNEHEFYTGRSKLDGATLDRFDIVPIDRDDDLERTLVDADTFKRLQLLRKILKETNSSISLSMRDSMRYQQRKDLGLLEGFVYRLVQESDLVFQRYAKEVHAMPKHSDQSECKTYDELLALIKLQAGQIPEAPANQPGGEPSRDNPYGDGQPG